LRKGFIFITYKVDYKSVKNKEINILDFLPSADYLKITETGIREIISGLYYLVKS